MKNRIFALTCVIFTLVLFINMQAAQNTRSVFNVSDYVRYRIENTHDENIPDELLGGDYGESKHWQTIDDIKVSLVSVNSEKHYISYSWASYDLSNLTVKLFAEDINKETLPKDVIINGIIKYGDNTQSCFYAYAEDFPSDEALGYKRSIYLYFYPLDNSPEIVDITLYYADMVFTLEDVDIVL